MLVTMLFHARVAEDDDCKPGNNACPENSVCVNTPDGFSCNCTEGYHNVDAVTCEGKRSDSLHRCRKVTECVNARPS